MDYKTFGINVRKYRRLKEMSQELLAEKCGCSNSHIGQIENARGIPSLEMSVNIANALGVTVDQLISTSYVEPEKVYIKEISKRIEKYPKEQQSRVCEALYDYLDTLEKVVLR